MNELKLGLICKVTHDPDAFFPIACKDGVIYGITERTHGIKEDSQGYMPIRYDIEEEQNENIK